MTFQRKKDPRISGGTRVDMFNNEFRVRLSWTTSPAPSLICFSRSRIESTLVSRPMLSDPTCVSYCRMPWHVCTYIEDDAFSLFGESCSWSLCACGGRDISGSGSWWFGDEIEIERGRTPDDRGWVGGARFRWRNKGKLNAVYSYCGCKHT